MYDELMKDLRENHDKYFARDMQAAEGGNMSDILIKGMEMPTNCMLCPFCVEEADPANGEMCMVTGTLMPPCTRERLDNCPLTQLPPNVINFDKPYSFTISWDGEQLKGNIIGTAI